MRVGLDLTPLISGDTGVSRYAQQLHEHLVSGHPEIELAAFAIGRGPAPGVPLARRVRTPLRLVHRSWSWLGRPRAEDLVGAVDVVHALDMVPPPARAPVVLTIHDLLPLVLPDLYGPRYRRIAQQQAAGARRAALVIADCDSTADQIAEVARVPRDRIVTVPLGARPAPPAGPPPRDGSYLLYVGAITPRKGLAHLLRALVDVPDAPPLVVAGPPGHRAGEVLSVLDELRLRDRVELLGRVDDASLERLFAHATLFCHPSIAEGFGIPVLEALAAGAPVLAADIPSIRDLVGGAAVLVPPADPAALADALRTLLADDEQRGALALAGRQRAAGYTWARTADETVAVYASLSGK